MRAVSHLVVKGGVMRKLVVLVTCLATVAVAAGCRSRPRSGYDEDGNLFGSIRISGAWAMNPLAVRWAEEFCREHPQVQISVTTGGAGKGMDDVLVNLVELAMVSRDVTPAEIGRDAWFVAVARDAVIPVFNSDNPNRAAIRAYGLTRSQFQSLFLGEGPAEWSQLLPGRAEGPIEVYTRSDSCGAAEIWAYYLGASQHDLKGVGVHGDPGMVEAVKKRSSAVGYGNMASVYDLATGRPHPGLDVIPIDWNEDGSIDPEESFYGTLHELREAVRRTRFPSPPARSLFFVSKGPPDDAVTLAFLHWVFGPGQALVSEAGYVGLSDHMLDLQRRKLPPKVR